MLPLNRSVQRSCLRRGVTPASRQRCEHDAGEVPAQIRTHVDHDRMNHAAGAVTVMTGQKSKKKRRDDNDRYGGEITAQTQERKVNQAERHSANYCSKREVVTEEPPRPGQKRCQKPLQEAAEQKLFIDAPTNHNQRRDLQEREPGDWVGHSTRDNRAEESGRNAERQTEAGRPRQLGRLTNGPIEATNPSPP